MITKEYRLASMPQAQCRVRFELDNNNTDILSVSLISYQTTVIGIYFSKGYDPFWVCAGVYRQATSRQINRFTKEFFGENRYQEAKASSRALTPVPLTTADIARVKTKARQYLEDKISKVYKGKY